MIRTGCTTKQKRNGKMKQERTKVELSIFSHSFFFRKMQINEYHAIYTSSYHILPNFKSLMAKLVNKYMSVKVDDQTSDQ